jgi:hypothetical protein
LEVPLMKSTHYGFLFRCATVAAVLLAPSLVHAIGPQYQAVGDATGPFTGAPAGTINSVVSLRLANGTQDGTGTVIGVTPADANGNVTFAILTARHVAVDVNAGNPLTFASFGVGPGQAGVPGAGTYALSAPLSRQFQSFWIVDPTNNPNNFPVDMAIMAAKVNINSGLLGNANNVAEYNLVTNPGNNALIRPFQVAPPAANSSVAANQSFTQFGYGTAGTFDTANNKFVAVSPQPDDSRRFQNNTINQVEGNAVRTYDANQTYFQPQVDWNILKPSNAGGGASFGGDSGGPYFTGSILNPQPAIQVSVTPSFVDNTNANNPLPPNVALNIPVNFYNYLAAVHVGGSTTKTVGNSGFGVPLVETGDATTGTEDWALYYANNPQLIPEPGSIVLLAFGGFSVLLIWYRRRR